MKGIRRIRQRLCALPLALACLAGLAACGGPDFGSFSKELTFGDKQISDTQTTYVMKIPEGKLGDLIGPSQINGSSTSTATRPPIPARSRSAPRRRRRIC